MKTQLGRNQRAFTLIEMLITIAALSLIITVGFTSYVGVKDSLKTKKLEQDIAAVNSAIRVYIGNGGRIGSLVTPQSIVDKLKTVPTADNKREIAGLRGSMIDPALEVVMQTVNEAESGDPRAAWNSAKKRFEVVRNGDPGVKGFRKNQALLLRNPVFDEDRIVSLKLAKNSRWVWDYFDTDDGAPNSFGPVNVGSTSNVPFGLPNTPAGSLDLNPPSFHPPGGTYALSEYEDFEVTISDPNPNGAAQVFCSTDGVNFELYLGQTFAVSPDETIEAVAVSLDPDFWNDSDMQASTYLANPVQLALDCEVPKNPLTYPEAGGEMVPAGAAAAAAAVGPISVTLGNADEVPVRYQSSDDFAVLWSYDGADPRDAAAGSSGTFSDGFNGVNVAYGLDQWGTSGDTLPVKIVAKSLNTGVLSDSEQLDMDIDIQKLALREPICDIENGGAYTSNQQVTLTPVADYGDLPVGWRIYYTTDGTDPGYTNAGEPLQGTPYTGAFDLFSGASYTADINARVYGPVGAAHWFIPSPLFTASVDRWELPVWDGYIGGDFSNNSYASFRNIKQHHADGVLDQSFNPGSGLDHLGRAVVLDSDGRAVVGGAFTTADGHTRNRVVRFDEEGNVDPDFNSGIGFDDEVMALAIQPDDGKILVGGKFRSVEGMPCKGLARLHDDGTLDTEFLKHVGGAVHSDEDGWVYSIAYWPGGDPDLGDDFAIPDQPKIYVGGYFSRFDGKPAKCLARLDGDGSFDASFDTTVGVSGYLKVLVLQPHDGLLLIGGSFPKYDNSACKNVARVLPSGNIDNTFQVKVGSGANKDVHTITLYPEGSEHAKKIFIGGNFNEVDKEQRKNIARLHWDGVLDDSFQVEFSLGEGQAVPSWVVHSSAITSNGQILVGGRLTAYNSQAGARAAFVRLKQNGAIDRTYAPEDLPQGSAIYGIAVRGDDDSDLVDRALVVGDFPEQFVVEGANIAKLDPATGAVDGGFDVGSGADAEVHAVLKLSDGDVLAGGEFGKMKDVDRKRLAKLGADGALRDLSVDIGGGDVYALAEDADGKLLIGGDFDSVDGDPSYRGIARLEADGTLDTSFAPDGTTTSVWVYYDPWRPWWGGYYDTTTTHGFDGRVRAIKALEDGTLLVGGEFEQYGGVGQKALALLDPGGSLNPLFSSANGNIPSTGSVYSMALLPNGKLVYAGSFTGEVACVNNDGTPDLGFTPAPIDGTVRSVSLQADGRLAIGGDFTNVGGSSRKRAAVLEPNGAFHAPFDSSNGADDSVHQTVALEGGKCVGLGEFSSYAGQGRRGTACVNPDGTLDGGFQNPMLTVNSINTTD